MFSKNLKSNQGGQSLIEAVIAAAVGIILVIGAVSALMVSLRANFQSKLSQAANELNNELLENVAAVGRADWHNLYDQFLQSSTTPYYLTIDPETTFFTLANGQEQITLNGTDYYRYFRMSEVGRDSNDAVTPAGVGSPDPSTLKITAYTLWNFSGQIVTIHASTYLTRSAARVFVQTEWAIGPGHDEVSPPSPLYFSTSTNVHYASSGMIFIEEYPGELSTDILTNNIIDAHHWAWSDVIGWIDFDYYNNVKVLHDGMIGYASSSLGIIAFDCATSPTQDCSVPYQVENDGLGNLSGWAWNDSIGWISFASSSVSSTYGVSIDDVGVFHGWAWSDAVGWISFNCDHTADIPPTQSPYGDNNCAESNYYVQTLWAATSSKSELTSSVFDTGRVLGAAFNSVMWQGTQPPLTSVKFQIATADFPTGPWSYTGPDGTILTYYQPLSANVQSKLNRQFLNNKQFLRYKVFLESDPTRTFSPVVNDIIINWSP